MKLLLDSHAFLWFVMGDSRLSEPARSAIEDPAIAIAPDPDESVVVVRPGRLAGRRHV